MSGVDTAVMRFRRPPFDAFQTARGNCRCLSSRSRRRPHQRHLSITCVSSPVIAASFTRSIARDHLAAAPPPR